MGTRLRPFTIAIPKPLVPIGDRPIAEILLRQLKAQGVLRATLCVNYQADILRAFFQDGSRWGIGIDYSLETTPLGTIGPLHLIGDLPDHFLVMNGDILSDIDFSSLYREHVQADRLFTISAYSRVQDMDYGVLEIDAENRLIGFREKPKMNFTVSMGIYVVSRRVLDFVPKGKPFGFDDLMLALIAAGEKVHVRLHNGYWMDIGRPDDYAKAVDDWQQGRLPLAQ